MTSQQPRKRRVRPAEGARVLATGLSVSAMFGLTTAMAVQAATPAQQQPDLVPAALPQPVATQPQVVVVKRYIYAPKPAPVIIHRSSNGTTKVSSSGSSNGSSSRSSGSSSSGTSSRSGSSTRSTVPKAKPAPAPVPKAPAPKSSGTSSGSGG
jgi:hypothetical protein